MFTTKKKFYGFFLLPPESFKTKGKCFEQHKLFLLPPSSFLCCLWNGKMKSTEIGWNQEKCKPSIFMKCSNNFNFYSSPFQLHWYRKLFPENVKSNLRLSFLFWGRWSFWTVAVTLNMVAPVLVGCLFLSHCNSSSLCYLLLKCECTLTRIR